jgi:hypothetical protein
VGDVDYLFALLTGYVEAPKGKAMLSGLYYVQPLLPEQRDRDAEAAGRRADEVRGRHTRASIPIAHEAAARSLCADVADQLFDSIIYFLGCFMTIRRPKDMVHVD